MKWICAALLMVFLPAAFAFSESENQGGDESAEMQDVVITATKTEQEILDVPQHVTVITKQEITESGAKSVAELLSRKSGVSTTTYGTVGSLQTVSLRGSTTEQVLVLIDGVRMNNPHSGGVDLSLIPLDNVERIEIVRGGASALYGADAVGGVVNVITRNEADDRFLFRIENGGYIPQKYYSGYGFEKKENSAEMADLVDSQQLKLQYSKGFRGFDFTTAGSFYSAHNSFIFKDSNDENRKRENAEAMGGDVSANIRVPVGEGDLNVHGMFSMAEKGVPGTVSDPTPNAEQSDKSALGSIRYVSDTFISEFLSFDLNTYFTYSDLTFKDPDYLPEPIDSRHKVYSTGVDFMQELSSFAALSLIYGGSLSHDRDDSTDVGEKQRTYGALFVQTPLYLSPSITLMPMIRYDHYSDFGGSVNFKLGYIHNLSPSMSFKSSLAKSFRAPTFSDLYWPSMGGAEGNPDLKPETGYSFDAGISRIDSTVSYDFFLFTRFVNDVILWQENDDGIWRPSNYGEALYPGIEAHVDVQVLTNLILSLNYTFLYSFALSGEYTFEDNKRLPNIPVHETDFGLTYRGNSFTINVNGHYESLRYENVENSGYLSSFFVVNANYRQHLSEKVLFLLALENLFSEQYVIISGYPMPGLFIRTGLEIVL